jgi:hypothetical protein
VAVLLRVLELLVVLSWELNGVGGWEGCGVGSSVVVPVLVAMLVVVRVMGVVK